MSFYHDNYCDYKEIDDENHDNTYDNSGCAIRSNDMEWNPPSELDYHYHDNESTPFFDLDLHNQELTPSGHYHENPTHITNSPTEATS